MRLARARKDDAQQFLGRRLADRARHGDDSRLRTRARCAAEIFERDERVLDDIERAGAGQPIGMRLVDQRRRRARFESLAHMIVAVGIIALQRDEQIAFDNRARIDRDAGHAARRQGAAHPRTQGRNESKRGPEGVGVNHASPSSAARTAS